MNSVSALKNQECGECGRCTVASLHPRTGKRRGRLDACTCRAHRSASRNRPVPRPTGTGSFGNRCRSRSIFAPRDGAQTTLRGAATHFQPGSGAIKQQTKSHYFCQDDTTRHDTAVTADFDDRLSFCEEKEFCGGGDGDGDGDGGGCMCCRSW